MTEEQNCTKLCLEVARVLGEGTIQKHHWRHTWGRSSGFSKIEDGISALISGKEGTMDGIIFEYFHFLKPFAVLFLSTVVSADLRVWKFQTAFTHLDPRTSSHDNSSNLYPPAASDTASSLLLLSAPSLSNRCPTTRTDY